MKRRIVKHVRDGEETFRLEYKKYWYWEPYLTHRDKAPRCDKIFADVHNHNWVFISKLDESEISRYETGDYTHNDSSMTVIPYFKRYECAKAVLDAIILQQDHETVIEETVVYET